MKKTALAALCLFSAAAFGQSKKFNFKLGEEYELPRKTEDLSFFGNDKDGIVNLSLKKEELHVIRFDTKKLGITNDQVIELPDATKNFNSEYVAYFNPDCYWLHSDWDKDAEKEILYYDKIDVASGKIASANNKIIEAGKFGVSYFSSGFMNGGRAVNKYSYNQDAHQTKLLVNYRLKPEVKNDKENYDKIGIYVFDNKMKKLWGREYTMPYTEAVMDNNDFTVDAQGNAYMLAKVYDSEKRRERDKETGKPAYHYEVLKFTQESNKFTKATITLGDYFVKQPTLIENSLGELLIACAYSKNFRNTSTDGIFLAKMDAQGKIEKYKNGYYEFPLAELEKFESAKKKRKMEKKDDYEAPNLIIRDVVVGPDGSVLLACEESYTVTTTYTSSNGSVSTRTTYYNEDIIASKINKTGGFDWVRKIPKRQQGGRGIGTMSFKLISDATGDYFLYLDNLKNIDLPESEEPRTHVDGYGGQVMVTKIDPTGKMTKELVFDTREEEVMIFPHDFTRINGNQFIGRARVKKNRYQPLLITVAQ